MRRATFAAVEGVLRDIPRMRSARWAREAYIKATLQGGLDSPRIDGGGDKLTGPEALCEGLMLDAEYCELTAVLEVLDSGLSELPEFHLGVLEAVYFEGGSFRKVAAGMGCDKMRVYRALKQALEIMRDPCLKVLLMVEHWRDRCEEREKQEIGVSRG